MAEWGSLGIGTMAFRVTLRELFRGSPPGVKVFVLSTHLRSSAASWLGSQRQRVLSVGLPVSQGSIATVCHRAHPREVALPPTSPETGAGEHSFRTDRWEGRGPVTTGGQEIILSRGHFGGYTPSEQSHKVGRWLDNSGMRTPGAPCLRAVQQPVVGAG